METMEMDRNPHIPLHPDIRQYALELVKLSVPLTQLQQRCRDFARDRFGDVAGDTHYRFILSDHETSSLYRTIFSQMGIKQCSAAEENLDLWFRAQNPRPPHPAMSGSCLYYQPCQDDDNSRFIIIISTPQQQAMAWQYGHNKLLLLDGTFGVNSARSLLFIGMVIDADRKGIPVVFIHFTARKSTTAAHADYNSELLEDLLCKWKHGMGKNPADGSDFNIRVVLTDNDIRERKALSKVYPNAMLLLCRFHITQAWRNALNRKLRVIPRGDDRQKTRCFLVEFLLELLKDVYHFEDAVELYNKQLARFQELAKKSDSLSQKMSQGGLAFLSYFHTYIKMKDFWRAWSPAGFFEASKLLGVSEQFLPRTTNHLESFNHRIKSRYFASYQHSGRLPRIDVWVLVLITKVFSFVELFAY